MLSDDAAQGTRYGGFGRPAAWTAEACGAWPRVAGQDRYVGPWNRPTADTILVVGNTWGPFTAYRNSVAMAYDLTRARLLTVRGFGHTEFFNPSTRASNYEFRYQITGAPQPQVRSHHRSTGQPTPVAAAADAR